MTLSSAYLDKLRRWGLGPTGGYTKVAIVGFCETNRDLTPYENPEFEIWGLNRGAIFMHRATRWFEMHGMHIAGSQNRRPGQHLEYLKNFNGPVYVHQHEKELGDNQIELPLQELAADFGTNVMRIGPNRGPCERLECQVSGHTSDSPAPRCTCSCHMERLATRNTTGEPYLTSSIAYEIGLAIAEGFSEIHLYGIDLNTESEYAWQKPGVEYLIGLAAGRGITVFLPENCPLLKGKLYGRGFMSPSGETMSYDQLATRMKALQHDQEQYAREASRLGGALRELNYLASQAIPGADHEEIERDITYVKTNQQKVEQMILGLRGKIGETETWLGRRIAKIIEERDALELEQSRLEGAHAALGSVQKPMLPSRDHEMTDNRRKEIEAAIIKTQQRIGETKGAIEEAAYWLHITMEGQDPAEAITQLVQRTLTHGAEGPITEADVLHSIQIPPQPSDGVQEPELLQNTVPIGAV